MNRDDGNRWKAGLSSVYFHGRYDIWFSRLPMTSVVENQKKNTKSINQMIFLRNATRELVFLKHFDSSFFFYHRYITEIASD